jgi:hypothetical protein
MSNLRITFTDPATNRLISLDANRAEQLGKEGDGAVDLAIDGFDAGLRIPAAGLDAGQVEALKRALANPDVAAMTVTDLLTGSASRVGVHGSDLGREIGDHVAPALPGANLDATGTRRPVSFSGNRFTAELGESAQTNAQIGEGLYAAAKLIDDVPGNAIEAMALSGAQRKKLLGSLQDDLAKAPAGGAPAQGLDATQTLQLRSSASTVLLELMTAKGTDEGLRQEALGTYLKTMTGETNGVLRDQMGWNLLRLAPEMPVGTHQAIGEALESARSTEPPYKAWFKEGDNTVTVDWSAGSESLGDDKKRLLKEGFEKVGTDRDGTIFEKTYEKNGVETKFRVRMRPFHLDMFKRVEDTDTDMVIYTGHSNWGRNMRGSLKGIDNPTGGKDKLVLTDLCVGKGEMQQFKDKFPNADMVTTFNSSYFIPGTADREANSEGINSILATFDGIAERAPYSEIAEDVRRANPWGHTHRREGVDNNFIFPGDEVVRRRVLDRDHDGQADILDRVVDFNSFKPETDAARDFTPVEGRPAAIQDGTKLHFAAMTVTRLGVYSGILDKETTDGRVTPGGLFDPAVGETDMFRFERQAIGGKPGIVMTMNSQYAHASEESLRAGACYEFARYIQGDAGNGVDNRLNALMFASHSLKTDTAGGDTATWNALLKAKGMPAINRRDVETAKSSDHDYYSGSDEAVKALRSKLDESVLNAIGERP